MPEPTKIREQQDVVLDLQAERDALREAGRAVVDTGVEVQDGVMVELAPLLALRDLVGDRPE